MLNSEIEQLKSQILDVSGVNTKKCMVCGKCSGTCPNYDSMEYHPHQFVQMVEKGEIEPLLKSKSIYACLSCFACLERCPRQVEPVKIIDAVRQLVEGQRGPHRRSAKPRYRRKDCQCAPAPPGSSSGRWDYGGWAGS